MPDAIAIEAYCTICPAEDPKLWMVARTRVSRICRADWSRRSMSLPTPGLTSSPSMSGSARPASSAAPAIASIAKSAGVRP